jgi:hypothetical protein
MLSHHTAMDKRCEEMAEQRSPIKFPLLQALTTVGNHEEAVPQCSYRISITPGEVYDRLVILELKLRYITNEVKLQHVRAAYTRLARECVVPLFEAFAALDDATALHLRSLVQSLRDVNEMLWDAEDCLRACERVQDFSYSSFVLKARSVYQLNDRRISIRNAIDELFGFVGEIKDFPTADAIAFNPTDAMVIGIETDD